MKLRSDSFNDGEVLDARLALGMPDPDTQATFADNKNPHLAWSELPEGTKSLVLICHDPDVPSVGDDVNQEGKRVPAELPRVDFYHWVLANLDPAAGSIAEGSFCEGFTAKGKEGPEGPEGTLQGINSYTGWFAGDAEMAGNYFGYDGPFPPWNDSILHHYHFTLYATDLEKVELSGPFEAPELLKAIEGHVLDQAKLVGTYTIAEL